MRHQPTGPASYTSLLPESVTMEAERKARKAANGAFQAGKEQWLKVVAAHPNLSGADLAVAITIARYLNSKTGDAWPSIETIADETNRERSTVWRSIVRLETFKLLEVKRARGRTRSNRYKPLLGDLDRDPKTLRRRNKRL